MKEFDSILEAIWTFTISKEKIFERLVEQGIFDKETTDEILEHMYSQLNLDYNPNFVPSPVCEVMYASKVDVPRACVSLTDIARTKADTDMALAFRAWLNPDIMLEMISRFKYYEIQINKKIQLSFVKRTSIRKYDICITKNFKR